MKINSYYFTPLREQICNPPLWNKDQFVAFNSEAGTGKSMFTHMVLGELGTTSSVKMLYVQRFVRDNELNNTVETINHHAGKEVAVGFSSVNLKGKRKKEKKEEMDRVINASVLCITHRMYIEICKGNHPELIKNRDILVIDEYPDLLEKIAVSLEDIGSIGAYYPEFEGAFKMLRDKYYKSREEKLISENVMLHCSFEENEPGIQIDILDRMIKVIQDKKHNSILRDLQQILKNGCYLYQDGFHSYNNIDFVMLKNNIILDANAGFDYRYKMSNKFVVRNQEKVFTNENSKFHHIEISTTKQALSNYFDFQQKILEMKVTENRKGVLFITDVVGQPEWENSIGKYRSLAADESPNISVDHFGNLIGGNSYRNDDTVVITKTPNYDYLTYVLTYFYYRKKDGLAVDDQIKLYKHEEIERLRQTIVAGEFYQAIKRINRDNSQSSEIYVFTDYEEAIEIVLEQLPNIAYVKEKVNVQMKKQEKVAAKKKESPVLNKQIHDMEELLLMCINEGRKSIKKKELREKIGVRYESRANMITIFKGIESFMKKHGIMMTKGPQIYFNLD